LPFLRQAAAFLRSSGDPSCIEETSLQFALPALSSLMGPQPTGVLALLDSKKLRDHSTNTT
jgi:hypothetical protein